MALPTGIAAAALSRLISFNAQVLAACKGSFSTIYDFSEFYRSNAV